MWVGLATLSVVSILLLNFASEIVPGKGFDSTGSFMILGLFALAMMRWLRVPTNSYFAMPVFGWRFLLALILMVNLIIVQVRAEPFSELDVQGWLRGGLFLISVAVAEEIFSRGVVFGVLLRHSLAVAVIGSSLIFGLMHINGYIGEYFDPWRAYWHIASAAAFGIFACALMVVTRSIWMPIILHTVSNTGLLFRDLEEVIEVRSKPVSVDFWDGLTYPLMPVATFVIPAIALLWINAGMPLHPVVQRQAIKWKLMEPVAQEELPVKEG
jgi:membrane protease YdiL (CAAX protease family)